MNDLMINQVLTMSSREIATLCDKRHDNVMADIRKMLDELDIYAPDFSGTFITEQGNTLCVVLCVETNAVTTDLSINKCYNSP